MDYQGLSGIAPSVQRLFLFCCVHRDLCKRMPPDFLSCKSSLCCKHFMYLAVVHTPPPMQILAVRGLTCVLHLLGICVCIRNFSELPSARLQGALPTSPDGDKSFGCVDSKPWKWRLAQERLQPEPPLVAKLCTTPFPLSSKSEDKEFPAIVLCRRYQG